jgi:ribose 5-phosphate isomerase B
MDEKNAIIPISCDHGGFEMKEFLVKHLKGLGYRIEDLGTFSSESVDYPDFIHPLAKAVNDGVYPLGIIICGSGNGAQMVANKYPKVRAALCWTVEIAKLARQHNNANILALPGRFVDLATAAAMAEVFLSTPFEGGRHAARVDKIEIH